MKKILVPCDFSTAAVDAFRFALEIADKSKGEIILLHAIELPAMFDTTLMPVLYFEEQALKDLKANAEKGFKKVMAKWAKGKTRVRSIIEYGPATLTIINAA